MTPLSRDDEVAHGVYTAVMAFRGDPQVSHAPGHPRGDGPVRVQPTRQVLDPLTTPAAAADTAQMIDQATRVS